MAGIVLATSFNNSHVLLGEGTSNPSMSDMCLVSITSEIHEFYSA